MSTNHVNQSIKSCPQWQVLSWNQAKLEYYVNNFLASLRHKSKLFSKQLRLKQNELAYKNQNVYLKINTYVNQASTLPCKTLLPSYRNQSTDLWSISMGWFPYNSNTGFKYANPNCHLFHILFSPFMKKCFSLFPKCST